MLFVSSFQVLTSQLKASDSPGKALSLKSFLPGPSAQILHNLAFQQLLLALFTLTTGHVQIVSRISSAYPVWLWYCAELLQGKDARIADVMIRFMAIYAIVQAGLYASFLPPA
jgi:phosphatidylinositol glycan class V